MREVADMPRLFKVYRDTRRWNEILGVADVGQFNELCISGAVNGIVKVAERASGPVAALKPTQTKGTRP